MTTLKLTVASLLTASNLHFTHYNKLELWSIQVELARKKFIFNNYFKGGSYAPRDSTTRNVVLEVVQNIFSVHSKTGEKVLFQNSYMQTFMGIGENKTKQKRLHSFPILHMPKFVTWYNSINHMESFQ